MLGPPGSPAPLADDLLVEELQARYEYLVDGRLLSAEATPEWLTDELLAEVELGVSQAGGESLSPVRRLLELLSDLERALLTQQSILAVGSAPSRPRIRGRVVEEGTGRPIALDLVRLYDSAGHFVAVQLTDATGSYAFADLPAGTYFVATDFDEYLDELYNDQPCPFSCDVTAGTPVAVASGAETSGIDFVLATGSSLRGTVTEEGSGTPIANTSWVQLYDSGGSSVASVLTDGTGSYAFRGLPAGTYFVRTDIDGYLDELYDGQPCPFSCDVTTGTPITVTLDSETSGIDFALAA